MQSKQSSISAPSPDTRKHVLRQDVTMTTDRCTTGTATHELQLIDHLNEDLIYVEEDGSRRRDGQAARSRIEANHS